MGELSEIQPPQMDWNASDLPTAFKSFKQYYQLIFDRPLNQKEEKVKPTYALLWIGEEGAERSSTLLNLATKKNRNLT